MVAELLPFLNRFRKFSVETNLCRIEPYIMLRTIVLVTYLATVRNSKMQMSILRNRLLSTVFGLLALVCGHCSWTFGQDSEILKQLNSGDEEQQLLAIEQIGSLDDKGAVYLEPLISLLSGENRDVANQAALCIGAMGPVALKAAPALVANMDDFADTTAEKEQLWLSFSRALFGIGPTVVPTLVAGIDDANLPQFVGICAALHDLGPAAEPALPKLIAKAKENKYGYRWSAVYVMEAIGKPAVEAMPVLIDCLKDEDFQFQVVACRVLAAIGPEAKEAKPYLFDIIEKGTPSAKGRAAIALGSIGFSDGDDDKVLKTLLAALNEFNQVVRERAVIGIGRLGPKAMPIVEEVRKAANSQDFASRSEACLALWRITGDAREATDILISLFEYLEHDLLAITALGEMGPAAAPAIPELLKRMENEDLSYALEGAVALGKMGPAAASAIPKLTELSKSVDPELRIVAKKALKAIDTPLDSPAK
jgi:HEAT repeat protein